MTSALSTHIAVAQGTPSSSTLEERVQQLTDAMAHTQTQLEIYQKQLQQLQEQLAEVRKQMAEQKLSAQTSGNSTSSSSSSSAGPSSAQLDAIREQQAMEESQIATHEQTKVETESKYPLKVSGLVLFNGFVNTRQVDSALAPTYAVQGNGSTGLSLRQTLLGFDARGPHLFGGTSHADLRVDFFARNQSEYGAAGLLRLRTAHARVSWQNTDLFFQQDRTLLEPNAPDSLVAVAQPEFSWSGNLWTWNPQLGVSHKIGIGGTRSVKLQAGFIDALDPYWPGTASTTYDISATERSRWPGTEARIAFATGDTAVGPEIGVSGYFSPHETPDKQRFDAWAAAMDLRLPIVPHVSITANAYRGAALGGLGGGGYVDYVYFYKDRADIAHALDDIGGWTQLKAKVSERLEFNTGYGIDNPFAREIRTSTMIPEYAIYHGLLKNRSAFGNVIYTPSRYLLFSLEYRRFWSNYLAGPTTTSDVIGIAAGYRF